MDRALLKHEVVWAAAGRPDAVFSVMPSALRAACGATLADVRVEAA
jgi:prolyl-tRNA editing enzyme YbaK/EbsC (Cys-tRNA(Pro) deacylase)